MLKRDEQFPSHIIVAGRAMGEAVAAGVRVPESRHSPGSIAEETERIQSSLVKLGTSLTALLEKTRLKYPRGEPVEIMQALSMICKDPSWRESLMHHVQHGLSAEQATVRALQDIRSQWYGVRNPYLRERLQDIEDLSQRLIKILTHGEAKLPDLTKPSIIFAATVSATELMQFDLTFLRGIVLEHVSPNSHATIVARALNIPLVSVAQGSCNRIMSGTTLIIDDTRKIVHYNPPPQAIAAFKERAVSTRVSHETSSHISSKDGTTIRFMMNAGLLNEVSRIHTMGFSGIGLYRTELPFLVSQDYPGVEVQRKQYRAILDAAKGKPVYFRTIDVGGDKVLPYLTQMVPELIDVPEQNPMMGMRSIRMAFRRPRILLSQLRALLLACEHDTLYIMFPMIAQINELIRVRRFLQYELYALSKRGLNPRVKIGVMIEVPSLLFQIDLLPDWLDFISIGSNDLVQFFFAADRDHPVVSKMYDSLSPVMLRLFDRLFLDLSLTKKTISFCGELIVDVVQALSLASLGFHNLSMTAGSAPALRQAIPKVDLENLKQLIRQNYHRPTPSLRPIISAHLSKLGILTS